MRQYGRKFVDRYVAKKIAGATETRDAVLVDIDTVSKVARVKINGSSKLVTAHYPRNWFTLPYYMKVGNAVRITHRGGVRGYVEISGEGRAIPFAVSVTDLVNPTLSDGIISGLEVTIDSTGTRFIVSPGTYRINGELYAYAGTEVMATVDPMMMEDPSSHTMGDFAVMGETSEWAGDDLQIIPPGGFPGMGWHILFGYIVLSIGVDGPVLTVGESTPDYTIHAAPVMPDIPSDHIQLAYLLEYTRYGTDYGPLYETSDLNVPWIDPYPSYFKVTNYQNISKWPCDSIGYEPRGDEDGDGVGAYINTNPYNVKICDPYCHWEKHFPCPAPKYRLTVKVMNQYDWPEWGPDGEPWQVNGQMIYGSGNSTFGAVHVIDQNRGLVSPSRILTTELSSEAQTEFSFEYLRDTATAGIASGYDVEEADPVFQLSLNNKGYEYVVTNIHINIPYKERQDNTGIFISGCFIQGQVYEKPVFINFGGSEAPTQLKVEDL
ncbi:MAG: hypothetical protein RBT11_01595 [Desulfobacterales bacterium]|jgi:hypothetical protein|nr:hypothetical protein [Desulfobacterales bacterium]